MMTAPPRVIRWLQSFWARWPYTLSWIGFCIAVLLLTELNVDAYGVIRILTGASASTPVSGDPLLGRALGAGGWVLALAGAWAMAHLETQRRATPVNAHLGLSKQRLPLRPFIAYGFLLIGLAIIGWLLHQHAMSTARETIADSLRTTSRVSAKSLRAWFEERQADTDVVSEGQLFADAFAKLISERGAAGEAAAAMLADQLSLVRSRYSYRSIQVLDHARSRLLLSVGRAPSSPEIEMLLGSVPQIGKAAIFLPGAEGAPISLGVLNRPAWAGRIRDLAIYFEFDLAGVSESVRATRLANGDGETLVVRYDKTTAMYLSRDGEATLRSLSRLPQPVRRAHPAGYLTLDQLMRQSDDLLAQTTHMSTGEAAVGVKVQIEGLPWWVVSLVPESAIYAPVQRQDRLIATTTGLFAFVSFLLLLLWLRSEHFRSALRESGFLRYYEEVLFNVADIFLLTDEDSRIVQASESAVQAFGYPRSRLIGMHVSNLTTPEQYQTTRALYRALKPGQTVLLQLTRIRADGSRFEFEGHAGMIELDGRVLHHSIGRDVTEQRKQETHRRIAAEVFNNSNAAIAVADAQRNYLLVNTAFTRITGYQPEDVSRGLNADTLFANLHSAAVDDLRMTLRRDTHWEGELEARRRDGSTFIARVIISVYRNPGGVIDQYVSIFTDQTRLKQAEGRAEYLARHDPLTGLPNRAQLDAVVPARMQAALDARRHLTFALINIDNFAGINSSLGHADGDAALIAVANRLRRLVPETHGLYRYGGDEFALVLDGEPLSHALLVNNLLAEISVALDLQEHLVVLTASIGLAAFPEHGDRLPILLRNMEAANRAAKSRGRNSWRLYSPEMNATAYDDMLIAMELRKAIEAQELAIHFQPQYRIADGVLVGMEALIRWNCPGRGMVSPARFIPIAESTGLIVDLSDWIFSKVCQLWSQWNASGLAVPVLAVNLSAIEFQQPDFLAKVEQTLSRHRIPPGAMALELTESLLMTDTNSAIETMHRLAALGLELAIDDFGTGYSSLSYLRRFPVKKLKIDRSFVLDLDRGKQGAAIAVAVIGMAKNLGMQVIAEGVETLSQRDMLHHHGCDEVQGFLYSRPLTEAATRDLLAQASRISPVVLPA